MKMQIIDTTDGQFIGFQFDSEQKNIHLPGGSIVAVERVIDMPGRKRFVNSNYIIDAEVVDV